MFWILLSRIRFTKTKINSFERTGPQPVQAGSPDLADTKSAGCGGCLEFETDGGIFLGRPHPKSKIWRGHAKVAGELRNEITEHMLGRGKAMQQDNDGGVCRTGLTIENLVAVDRRVVVTGHASFSLVVHGCLHVLSDGANL